jgi:hypothetical protein
VRCADFLRCKEACRNEVAHAEKLFSDVTEAESQMVADVFEKAELRSDFPNNPSDIWPEVTWVVSASLFTSDRPRLAGITANDAIHSSTPRAAVEGSQIRPHRR